MSAPPRWEPVYAPHHPRRLVGMVIEGELAGPPRAAAAPPRTTQLGVNCGKPLPVDPSHRCILPRHTTGTCLPSPVRGLGRR